MMQKTWNNSKQKSLRELLEVIEKGVDLLSSENVSKDLYDAFEKYALSTIKMVDEAFSTNYSLNFIDGCNPMQSYFNWGMGIPKYQYVDPMTFNYMNPRYNPILGTYENVSEYKDKLKAKLHQILLIAKTITYE